MGAWGIEVMENDSALDIIDLFVESKNLEKDIRLALQDKNYDIEEHLLAVALVDISLNGINEEILGSFYQYGDWLKKLIRYPMENLRKEALIMIRQIQKEEDETRCWDKDCEEERKNLLALVEQRLARYTREKEYTREEER